jgi:hypothetical protein
MIAEGFAALAMGATVIVAAIAVMPRCPECGCRRPAPDSMDPALRHCLRCLAVFQPGARR